MPLIASPRLVLNHLDPTENGATIAIFAPAPGDIVAHKAFSAATPSIELRIAYDPGHPPAPELVVGQTYTIAIHAD